MRRRAAACLAALALAPAPAAPAEEQAPGAPAEEPAPGPPPGAPAPRGGGGFPTPERLEDLADDPLPESPFQQPVASVDAWTLEGPFPDVAAAAPYREPSDWSGLLDAEAARRAGLVVPTEAMHCAAREWGRFFLEHGAPPARDLADWMGARCSVTVPSVSFHHFDGGVPETGSDEEILEAWRGAVVRLLRDRLVGGPQTTGIWYGREDGRAVVVVATGERLLRLDPLPTVPGEDGTVVVRGELLVQAARTSAALNRGRFGVEGCEADERLRLPRFAFRCRVDPADASSWLAMTVVSPGRIVGRSALNVLLWPSGEPTARWERPSYGEPTPVTPETDVPAAVARLVNDVRTQAGLEPVDLVAPQSETARRLAPWFFASLFGTVPPQMGDLVVLGMLAGWSVDGIVESGEFTASWVAQTTDLNELVSSALQYPGGRIALLSPEVRRIAVGTLVEEREDRRFLAGIFGTYSIFDAAGHDEAARTVIETLDAARAARQETPVRHLPDVAALGKLAASRVQGGEAPKEVLQDLLHQSSRVLQRSVNGWYLEARDLSRLRFPEELLTRDVVELAVGVSHHRPEGEPWGRYVVLLVAAGPEGAGA